MYGYIYETTNLINGKKYIGQHIANEFDPDYKGSGKYLWRAINKYGWNNFSVRMLCHCFSQEELDAEEIDYIAHCNAVESPDYYNLQAGGQSGNISGSKLSDETKLKMSQNRKGRFTGNLNHMYGKHLSDETKNKISMKLKGKLSGKNNPMYGKHWSEDRKADKSAQMTGELNPFYGKKHSEDTKRKLSESRMGADNPCYSKIWITNGTQNKRVNSSELNAYIEEGWKKGRSVSNETRRRHAEAAKSRYRDSSGKFL